MFCDHLLEGQDPEGSCLHEELGEPVIMPERQRFATPMDWGSALTWAL